jgi:membrane fusion protein, multidrug efflux system
MCDHAPSQATHVSGTSGSGAAMKRLTLSPRALLRLSLTASVLLVGAGAAAQEAPQAPPPPAVTVASVVQKDVTPSVTFNGRIEAVDSVDLRARVEGFVAERRFVEGDDIKAGDLLFVLEKDAYEDAIAQIRGQITSAEGTLLLAEIEVRRQGTLVEREAVAQALLDQATAKHAQALGDLQRLQAALKRAELDLGYTDIRAPMDGKIGRSAYSVGDVVGPGSEALATIVSQDPMYVTFPVTARELLEVLKTSEARGQDPRSVQVKLRLPDGSIYDKTGKIDFLDVQIDPTTDTVIVRATMPNTSTGQSERILIANQLVGVIIEQAVPEQALVIPQAAVAVDQAGPFVLVVGEDGTTEQRRIRPGSVFGSETTVTEGLGHGEKVIVGGLQKVRPGQAVTATPVADLEVAQ